jgi:hypothetical protein
VEIIEVRQGVSVNRAEVWQSENYDCGRTTRGDIYEAGRRGHSG